MRCFTGTRQRNVNNACELNYCSTWLVLNQLLPRKLTQSSGPAGKKCALTAALIPWSQIKKNDKKKIKGGHCFTFPPHMSFLVQICVPPISYLHSLLCKRNGGGTSSFSLINHFLYCLALINCVV